MGHLQFRIGLTAPDREASVDIIMPSGVRPDRYYKYGRTPAMPSTAWYRFDYDGSTGAEFPFPQRLRLNFIDGERGDADLIVNSAIIDPGAPGLARTFVTIDFKAAADNVINPRDKGKFWVAILSDADFDARQVNVSSITLGPAAATVFRQRQKVGDADGNGYPDLWVQFRTKDTGIACGDTEVILKAGTPGGELIVGRDVIRTVGCK